MQVYQVPQDRATYNFRYFLPFAPEWGTPTFCRQRVQELLDFCREAQVEAVQFFVNTRVGFYYMPMQKAADQAHFVRWMQAQVAPALRAAGVSYQLNLQALLGHGTLGMDMRADYPWERLVNEAGQETFGPACPLGPRFREIMGAMLRQWAATEPDVIWVDDDYRLHNHGLDPDMYCYCDRHLDGFGAFIGARYARAALVREALRPGPPSLLRQQWLDYLGRSMAECSEWIRCEVQGVSPHTRLAQMTSNPDMHAVEGRDWRTFLGALCGPYRPLTRPPCGIYTGTATSLKAHTCTYRLWSACIHVVDRAVGPGQADYGLELENYTLTTWAKSAANTRYALILGQLVGAPQITLSISDEQGQPISDEPSNAPLLRDTKPRLDALAALRLNTWRPRGLAFLVDPRAAHKLPVAEGARMADLLVQHPWDDLLLGFGLPGKYVLPDEPLAADEVLCLSEDLAWLPSDAELRRALAGAVLLDSGAARVLSERGLGEYLGVQVGQAHRQQVTAERAAEGVLPGVQREQVLFYPERWCELTPQGGQVAGWLLDGRCQEFPALVVHENALGGRVAVYASAAEALGSSFANHARVRWLHGLLRWLSRERFPVLPHLAQHGLCVLRDGPQETLLAFANLGTDPVTTLRLRCARRYARVRALSPTGDWLPLAVGETPGQNGATLLELPASLEPFGWLVLRMA